MWIQKTKAGNYQFFERYKDKNGKYRVVSVTYPKKSPAYCRKAMDMLRSKINAATRPKSEKVTLQDLADRYSAWKYATLKEQTAKGSEIKIQTIIDKLGPDMLVSDLTPLYYVEHMDYAPGTYNEKLTRFKAMIRWGYKHELIEDITFLDRIDRKKDVPHRIKIQDKYLEKEELKKLLEGLNTKYALVSEFLALTGMRISELIDLRKDHVDTEKRTILIDSTYAKMIRKSSSVKTEMSNREIYIQNELMDCIERINENRKYIKSVYFFPAEDGTRLDYDAYRIYLARHSEELIGRKITPHIFRHTHTSLLCAAGIPLEQISRRLGHADSQITRDVYMHVTKQVIERENERLDRINLL